MIAGYQLVYASDSLATISEVDWKGGAYLSFGGPIAGVEANLSTGTYYPIAGHYEETTVIVGGEIGGKILFGSNTTTLEPSGTVNIGPMVSVQRIGAGAQVSYDFLQGDITLTVRVGPVSLYGAYSPGVTFTGQSAPSATIPFGLQDLRNWIVTAVWGDPRHAVWEREDREEGDRIRAAAARERSIQESLNNLDLEDQELGAAMRELTPPWDPPPQLTPEEINALWEKPEDQRSVPYPETGTFGGAPAKAEDIPRWAEVGPANPKQAVPYLPEFQQYQQIAQLNCFAKGTPIALADGSSRPIEAIRPGDRVLAFDGRAGRGVPRRVVRLFANATDEWLVLRPLEPVAGFTALTVTPAHVFLAADGTFRCIDDILRRDGRIVLADGAAVAVAAERVAYAADTAHRYEAAEAVDYAAVGCAALAPRARKGWRTDDFEVEDLHIDIAGGVRGPNDSRTTLDEAHEQRTGRNRDADCAGRKIERGMLLSAAGCARGEPALCAGTM